MFNRRVLEQNILVTFHSDPLGLTYTSLILSCLSTPFWAGQPDVGPALADGPGLLIRGRFIILYHRSHRRSADNPASFGTGMTPGRSFWETLLQVLQCLL